MNEFLRRLEIALTNLPGNPKPSCKGFYIAYYDRHKKATTAEKIGFVPDSKDFQYLHFSLKKATQTLFLNKIRSKDFENSDLEQYAGGVQLANGCAGVSGHDPLVDEAIAILWLTHKEFIFNYGTPNVFTILSKAAMLIEYTVASDNTWVGIIADRIVMAN